LKDFVSIAAPLGLTHILLLSSTEARISLKIGKLPQGPTLTFNILKYTLNSDLRKKQKSSAPITGVACNSSPCVVLHHFQVEDKKHLDLAKVTLQALFPTINIRTAKASAINRVVLFQYNKDTDTIEFRHYLINTNQLNISKSIKETLKGHVRGINEYKDIADYVLSNTGATESDKEDAPETHIDVINKTGKSYHKVTRRSVRLTEIGPRLQLQLVKVEAELCNGDILYHKFVHKTKRQIEVQKQKRAAKLREKEKRKMQQQDNVKKKSKALKQNEDETQDDETQEDIEWYKKEVGEEPDKETVKMLTQPPSEGKPEKFNPLYRKRRKNTQSSKKPHRPFKKRKFLTVPKVG